MSTAARARHARPLVICLAGPGFAGREWLSWNAASNGAGQNRADDNSAKDVVGGHDGPNPV
jgi:hypothetical protein